MSIYTDQEAFGSIKEASRPIYVKNWEDFLKIVPEFDKESGKPTEDMVMKFVKYLRLEKNLHHQYVICLFHYYYYYVVFIIINKQY